MKLKVDLHVHTCHSPCGMIAPYKIETIAVKKGLDAVAITDHNTIDGALKLASCAKVIKVIVGEEVYTNQGEVIGYFLKEPIKPFLSVQETIHAIRAQGGIVSIPHPFDRLRSSSITRDALNQVIAEVDMIEVFNGRDILQKIDNRFLKESRKNGVVEIVGSDAHQAIEVGRSLVVMEHFQTPEEFLQNIRNAQLIFRKNPLWVHIVTKIMKIFKRFYALPKW